ncbi:MAG: hypothetical protein ACTHJR_04815 [Sphingomonas sp.]|uniref:hypothetical protein n=1 Tax=Sphingomonas sp. TaxID=28214 RepID=UPI003F8239B1
MILAFALAMSAAAPATRPAAPHTCRIVHGRLMATNGNPGLRIWEIGSHHYLALDVGQDLSLATLPGNVRRLWIARTRGGSLFDASIYGDFRVCALKPRRAGEMEMVHLVAARHLAAGSYR